MVNCLDLSNELIAHILHFVQFSTFESLALSNTHVHGILKSALQQHLTAKRRFTVPIFGNYEDFETRLIPREKGRALLLLGTILEDGGFCRYPRIMRIGDCGGETSDEDGDLDEDEQGYNDALRKSVIAHLAPEFKRPVHDSSLIPDDKKARFYDFAESRQ